MEQARRPVLVTNPADDRDFAVAAERLLDDGFLAIDSFRDQLRLAYPDVAVHRREIAAELVLVWYVYRHGRWVNSQLDVVRRGASPGRGVRR